ncbi:cancer-related nucleoside-triphosphatase isoform X2 [Exaiptasia diaphana]|nr:cancer-related nucleoside-triphosphatase isoform X2 [Exaiptasia diaphana]
MKNSISTQGFYTEEVRNDQKAGRIGFDIVTLTGERSPLARLKEEGKKQNGPSVGKYLVDLKSFESLAMSSLQFHHDSVPSSVVIVDEIGKMELFSRLFSQAVSDLFESKTPCILATVPIAKQRAIPFVERLKERKDVVLIEVTRTNRSSIADEVLQLISSAICRKVT